MYRLEIFTDEFRLSINDNVVFFNKVKYYSSKERVDLILKNNTVFIVRNKDLISFFENNRLMFK